MAVRVAVAEKAAIEASGEDQHINKRLWPYCPALLMSETRGGPDIRTRDYWCKRR
jgi:hypothetical protein